MFESNQIFQAAYVVEDLDAAMDNWMRVAQIGPFFVLPDCAPDVIYRGQPGELLADVAFCQAGSTMIELIKVKSDGPNHYRDTVPKGTDAYHHQGYFTDDFDAEVARFAAMGVEAACLGQFETTRYAYFDTTHLVGCMTEVLERDPLILDMFKKVADAAENWDGSDPVRMI